MKNKLVVLLFSFLLFACDKPIELVDKAESGVIASVNNVNILFTDLEKMLDLKLAAQYSNQIETQEELQTIYNSALYDLIVQELIHQELIQNNVQINYTRVNSIEQAIASDYLDADFKEILKEDGIDYDFWKKQILASYEKYIFYENVLRAKISMPIEDIEKKYIESIQNYSPETFYTLTIYRSSSKDELVKVQKNQTGSEIKAMNMRVKISDLPDEWKKEVTRLPLNKASGIHEDNGEFVFVIVQGKENKSTPDMLELYTSVEQELTYNSLRKEFEIWLENKLNSSEIKVSKILLSQNNFEIDN